MSDLPSRHGPLSTIAGWMTLIAVIGVVLAVAPPLSVLAAIGLIETLAVRRFMAYRRGGKPMSARVEAAWMLVLSMLLPSLGAVAVIAALIHYFST